MTAPRRAAGARTSAATLAVLTTAAALVVALPAAPASAHDVLVSTSPAAGSTVDAVPAAVVLTFDRPALALGTALEVTGPSGDVAAGPAVLVDSTVRQALGSGAPAGSYTVRWRVTSADGHPVSGSFAFTALAAGGDPSATASSSSASTGAATGGTAGAAAGASVLWWSTTVVGVAIVGGFAAMAGTRRRRRDGAGDDARDPGRPRREHAEGNER